jgi:integrase/recombinase XerD
MGPADDVDTDLVASEARRHPAIEDFVLWLTVERGRSSNTLAAYGRDLARYQAHLARRGVDPLTATDEDVLAFVHVLQGEGLAPSSVTRTLVAVRGLHRFLVADEIRADDPAADIEIPSIPKGLPKALTLDQVTRLIESVGGDDAVSRRDAALLETLYGTGARISEVVGLSISDVDLHDGLVRLMARVRRNASFRSVGWQRRHSNAGSTSVGELSWPPIVGPGAVTPRRSFSTSAAGG